MNHKPDVDPLTRERVLRLIQQQGFVPDLFAAQLADRPSPRSRPSSRPFLPIFSGEPRRQRTRLRERPMKTGGPTPSGIALPEAKALVWSAPEKNPLFALPLAIVATYARGAASHGPDPFALSYPGVFERELTEAGFRSGIVAQRERGRELGAGGRGHRTAMRQFGSNKQDNVTCGDNGPAFEKRQQP